MSLYTSFKASGFITFYMNMARLFYTMSYSTYIILSLIFIYVMACIQVYIFACFTWYILSWMCNMSYLIRCLFVLITCFTWSHAYLFTLLVTTRLHEICCIPPTILRRLCTTSTFTYRQDKFWKFKIGSEI